MGPPRISSLRNLLEKVGCNSGPIKPDIFDIYRSMLTRSKCLGLSSSIFDFGLHGRSCIPKELRIYGH